MGLRPQSIGEEFGGVSIRDDPELGTYFLKPPKCHIAIYRFSYWARDPSLTSRSRRTCLICVGVYLFRKKPAIL